MKQVRLDKEKIGAWCESLAHLYHAGIGIGDALTLMAEDEPEGEDRTLFAEMAARADEGVGLAEVFRETGKFPAYVCGLIEVGEQTGRTEECLEALAGYYGNRAKMEQQVKTALLYPMVMLAVLLAVVILLLVWVLPVFNDVYMQLGSRLTGLAGGLLLMGTFLRRAMPVLCVVIGVAMVAVFVWLYSPSWQERVLNLWYRWRGDKGIYKQWNTARFTQALAMGMQSGMLPQEAVELAAGLTTEDPAFQSRCGGCLERMDEGESMSAALQQAGLLGKADCRLLESGMKAGRGEVVMGQIAQRRMEESERAWEEKTARIEPVLIVIMSVLVGSILLSVMLPLMNIMTTIG